MTTTAEALAKQSELGFSITAGSLRERGGGWDPRARLWKFHDGSCGKFSEDAQMCNATGKYGYPFIVALPPMEFPDEAADASAEAVATIQRNARGEPIAAILPGEEVPQYTGEHAPAAVYGRAKDGSVKASVTGQTAVVNPRPRVSMQSSRVEATPIDEGDENE